MDESRRSTRVAAAVAFAIAVSTYATVVRAQGVRSNPVENRTAVRPAERRTATPGTGLVRPEPRSTGAPDARLTLTRPDSVPGEKSTAAKPASPWWTVLALFFVVGLVLALARIWRKHVPGASSRLPGEAVEFLGRRPLSPREAIQLVRIGSRILVLGSSADGLRPLAEIDDPVEVDYLAGMCRASQENPPVVDSFRDWFRRATTRTDESTSERTEPAPRATEPTGDPRGDDELRQRLSERLGRRPARREEAA